MTPEELRENEDRLKALEARLNSSIENIEKLNKIIFTDKSINAGQRLLSIKDVSQMAGLSRSVIEHDIQEGILDVVHRGKRKLIPTKSAKKYIEI